MNLSGGWIWHWRALRSRRRWQHACQQIEDWLLAQALPSRQLVLIGASAGWMLPGTWLQRFESVQTWDIDPLAARLFRWRHGPALRASGIALDTRTGDALRALPELVREQAEAFFWFDNLFGQLRFMGGAAAEVPRRLTELRPLLQGVNWGSVHDRMSGPTRSGLDKAPQLLDAPAGVAMESPQVQDWLLQIGAISPWLDHMTEGALPAGTPARHVAWPFRPGYAHWLEMGWCKAGARPGTVR
jgi:hypothetical protein